MSTMNDIIVNKQTFTTFSDSDYNSTAYNDYRPTYSPRLFSKIYDYHASHSSSFSSALDVATGTGLIAKKYQTNLNSAAEDLSQFQDSTLDLMTVGQAVHWFDREKFFNEAWRVLKPSGTLAIWGYDYDEKEGKMSNGDSLLSKEWSVKRINGYMKTWSAYKNYMAK
ncbi:hypothetical protein C2G38_2043601 [Gigaspora rosea]|uniref:Methyltransferase type 11 domain-containing protein n=1 Tax=Gigaspora rosea TaxID=44941 RepID=A0A397US65_9GLOM|nr:hypothetical protein C2G38_2043601 [Gigaspora rosea]